METSRARTHARYETLGRQPKSPLLQLTS